MTAQPQSSQFSIGAPPAAPSGASRLQSLFKVAASGGLMIAGGLYLAELTLPYPLKPSVVTGGAGGRTIVSETETVRAIKIDYERRLADAHAQPQAKAQADVIAMQKVLEERTESLRPVSAIAGLADLACVGSGFVSSLTMPQGWGRGSNDDIYYGSQRLGAAICGKGNAIRQEVTRSQIEAVRTVTGERGMSMDNGAEPVTRAADSATASDLDRRALQAIDAVTTASHRYEDKYHDYTEQWAAKLPSALREHLYADLPDKDVLVERAMAMNAVYSPGPANMHVPYIGESPEPAPVVSSDGLVHTQKAPPIIETKLVQAAPAHTARTAPQQVQLRAYSYRLPPAVLQKINTGLDLHHGYSEAWYDRVAAYQAMHRT